MTPSWFHASLDAEASALAGLVSRSVVDVRSGDGFGAGTWWRPDGLVVTNHHVVPHDHAHIDLPTGTTAAGRVIARDPVNDLAVLAVDARGLPALLPRDAGTLRAGEVVLAVGHPFGVRHAASVGIVASLESGEVGGRHLIRTTVQLGPGNSGGPLVDARGRVVGINAMVGGGLGLAVPADLAERLVRTALARRAA